MEIAIGKLQVAAAVLAGLAIAVAAPAYSASPGDGATMVTTSTGQIQQWYGRAGGLTSSARVQNLSHPAYQNTPVEVVPSKVFNDFTYLPGRSTPGEIATGLPAAGTAGHSANLAPYTGLAKSDKLGRASG